MGYAMSSKLLYKPMTSYEIITLDDADYINNYPTTAGTRENILWCGKIDLTHMDFWRAIITGKKNANASTDIPVVLYIVEDSYTDFTISTFTDAVEKTDAGWNNVNYTNGIKTVEIKLTGASTDYLQIKKLKVWGVRNAT